MYLPNPIEAMENRAWAWASAHCSEKDLTAQTVASLLLGEKLKH